MSVSNGLASGTALQAGRVGPALIKEVLGVVTASGTVTLTNQYRNILKIDPGGSARDVLLPPEEDGLFFWLVNGADAAENLVVKDDSGVSTLVTINQNESAVVACQGSTWYLVAVVAIALS